MTRFFGDVTGNAVIKRTGLRVFQNGRCSRSHKPVQDDRYPFLTCDQNGADYRRQFSPTDTAQRFEGMF